VNKGLIIRADQCSVKRLLPKLISHIREGFIEPRKLITRHIPLKAAADAYHIFSAKLNNCLKTPEIQRSSDFHSASFLKTL
jgi:threonine dehydrogenase-like Zn-dependent dehydrogenase